MAIGLVPSGRGRWAATTVALVLAVICMSACATNSQPAGTPNQSSSAPILPMTSGLSGPNPPISSDANTQPGQAVTMPQACQVWHCVRNKVVELQGGYSVALWVPRNSSNLYGKPMLALMSGQVTVQWWTLPTANQGFATNSLTCTHGAVQSCGLAGTFGAHSGWEAVVVLRNGQLIGTSRAMVITDSGYGRTIDLDGDGYLDAVGPINDYKPNYAQGTEYWQTFRWADDALVLTGCEVVTGPLTKPPSHLLTGTCPTS